MDLVWVPAGSFVMGSPPGEEGRQPNDSDEDPQHLVTISRGFWLGRCEVTQEQWARVTGRQSPAHFAGSRHPVESVSWDEVRSFLHVLNQSAGADCYRLPTEAEWEYACRAGGHEPFAFGGDAGLLHRYAWFEGNAGDVSGRPGRTRPVGLLQPNRWGLHDMHGNVWEWCADRYAAGYYAESPRDDPDGPSTGRRRVKRGGGWFYPWYRCRSADRARGEPDARSSSVGFRLVRKPD
jgi:formylglycine-generating enzyme required for sulfatase activity